MIKAFTKSVEQLNDPAFLKVTLYGIVGAIAAFIVLWSGVGYVLDLIDWHAVWGVGWFIDWAGQDNASAAGSVGYGIMAVVLSVMLFPALMTAIVGVFLDDICKAVEDRHFADQGPAREQPLMEAIGQGLKFFGVMVALNIAVLPIYFLLLIVFGAGAFLFYLVNGYLVGREFFELVAARRYDEPGVRRMHKMNKGKVFLFGIVFVFLMTVPIVNLVAPILAAATMVHLFQTMRRPDGSGVVQGGAHA